YLPPLLLLLLLRLLRPLSPSDRDIDAARPGQSIGCGLEFSSFEPASFRGGHVRVRCLPGTWAKNLLNCSTGCFPWGYHQHDHFETIGRHCADPKGKVMDRLRRLWLPLLAISFLIPAQGTEVREGAIQGVVLGEGRQPVRGAKVHAELTGVPMSTLIRYVETDENGFFLIDQLEFGKYYVAAKNEEEEYGDSGFSFFNDQPVRTAQISAQHRIADVVINLGPKAGVLTGTISNAVTGKPIPAGSWSVQEKDRNKWISTSATPNLRVLIPSSRETKVKVSAPG